MHTCSHDGSAISVYIVSIVTIEVADYLKYELNY